MGGDRVRRWTSEADGAQLSVESFGSPTDPTVLLIAGASQSMVWWEDDLCVRLAEAGRHVVRYDHRDTGRSTTSPAGRPGYTAGMLATDPLRIMDAMGVERAHLVGLSMGGGIAQQLALTHPGRVATLCLIATSPLLPPGGPPLPPPAPRVRATFTDPRPEPDWSDRDAVVAHRVEAERPYAGALGFDEARTRRLATLEVDRTRDMRAAMTNHLLLAGEPPTMRTLDAVRAPTLVLHGTTDPMFPFEHGEALADLIPDARLVALPGAGHQQPPPELWPLALSAISEHTGRDRGVAR